MLFYYYMFDVVVFSSTSSDRASSVEEVGQRRRHGTWRQVGLHHRGRLLLLLLYRLAVVCSVEEKKPWANSWSMERLRNTVP